MTEHLSYNSIDAQRDAGEADIVQAILATNGRQRGKAIRAKVPAQGMVFGQDARALTPWFTPRKIVGESNLGTKLPTRENKEHAGALPPLDVVTRAVQCDATLDEAQVNVAMTPLDAVWDPLPPSRRPGTGAGPRLRWLAMLESAG